MKSRVHPKYKTKYRVKNWASYDRTLVRRGDVTVWLSPEAIATWKPTGVGKRGQHLDVRLRRIPPGEVTHLIVDSTGLSIVGEGEWAGAKHGGKGKRGWRKLHLGVDGSGVIVAQVLTDGNADDAATVPDLLGQFEGELSGFVLRTRRHRKLRR